MASNKLLDYLDGISKKNREKADNAFGGGTQTYSAPSSSAPASSGGLIDYLDSIAMKNRTIAEESPSRSTLYDLASNAVRNYAPSDEGTDDLYSNNIAQSIADRLVQGTLAGVNTANDSFVNKLGGITDNQKQNAPLSQYYKMLDNEDFEVNSRQINDRATREEEARKEEFLRQNQLEPNLAESFKGAYDAEALEDEKRIYTYLWNTQGKERADQYWEELTSRELKKRAAKTQKEKSQKFGEENPILASIASIPLKPFQTVEGAKQLLDFATTGKLNEDDALNSWVTNMNTGLRQGASDRLSRDVANEWTGFFDTVGLYALNNAGVPETDKARIMESQEVKDMQQKVRDVAGGATSKAYGVTMSIADNLYNLALAHFITGTMPLTSAGRAAAKTTEELTTAIMGSSVVSESIIQAKERGLDDGQAATIGLASGVIEWLTEHIGMDALFDADKALLKGQIVKYVRKSMYSEGAEEVLSDLGNWVVDEIVTGDKSEFNTRINELMAQGMSKEEAQKQALIEKVMSMGESFLAGAISGGVLGGGGAVIGVAQNANTIDSMGLRDNANLQALIEQGLASSPNTDSYQVATGLQSKLDSGQRIKDSEIMGQIYANDIAIEQEHDNAMQTIAESSPNMSQAAVSTMQMLYGDNMDATEYAQGMHDYYLAGYKGESINSVQSENGAKLTPIQQKAIYDLGKEELNEELRIRKGGKRNDSTDTNRLVSEVEENAGRFEERNYQAADREIASVTFGEEIPAREVVPNGTDRKVRLVTGNLTPSLKHIESDAKKFGYKVKFVSGLMESIGRDGEKGLSRGQVSLDNKTIYVQVDNPDFTAKQIYEHEKTHWKIANGEINLKEVGERIKDQNYAKLAKDYAYAYHIVDVDEDGKEIDAVDNDYILEEIICDANAGMNIFKNFLTRLEQEHAPTLDSIKEEVAKETNQANAPPVETENKGESEVKTSAVPTMDGLRIEGKTAAYTSERIDSLLRSFAASNPDYAQAYVAYMSPEQFIGLTATSAEQKNRIQRETTPLDTEQLKGESQPIELFIDHETGEVSGHEGRHRMNALKEAGISKVPVVLIDYSNKYSKQYMPSITLTEQNFDNGLWEAREKYGELFTTDVKDLYPLSRGNEETIRKVFGGNAEVKFSAEPTMDSEGRKLSKDMSEYMKDSKIRDENGNLLVLYHGSSEKFTVFKLNAKGNVNGRVLGDGYYFTRNKSQAKNFAHSDKAVVYKVYLNITNPYYASAGREAPADVVDAVKEYIGDLYDKYSKDSKWWGNEYTRDEYIEREGRRYANAESALNWLGDNSTEKLKELGYDGIIYEDNEKNFSLYGGEQFVAFYPEQIKKTTNENPTENEDIRFSSEPTKDSLGNNLTKEQGKFFKDSQVRDSEGNLMVMYHGTENGGFTVFDSRYGISSKAFFFTNNPVVAKGYSGTSDTFKAPIFKTIEEAQNAINNDMMANVEIKEEDGKYVMYEDGDYVDDSADLNSLYWLYNEYSGYGGNFANYEVYLNVTNPLVIDAKGAYWGEIETDFADEPMNTNAIAEYAQKNGYDGVIVHNVIDSGVYNTSREYVQSGATMDVIVFDSNQVKLTSNENPTSNPDIRFSTVPTFDNKGRELTPEQTKRFADSKMRDAEGDLMTMYHGTIREFYEFSKDYANAEGNFGKGFYFTSNENDVDENYANPNGADYTNKIEREADMLEGMEEYEGKDHDEIVAELRKKYETSEEPVTHEVYLDIKNPCYVGSKQTYLLDDVMDAYDMDDFEDEDEYYAEVDQYVADVIDDVVWSLDDDFSDYASDISGILWEAATEGGITAENLRKKLDDLYIEDSEGNLASSEVLRQIIENLGYDGIIDDSVSEKFKGMHLSSDTVHAIIFDSSQAKLVTNENPTSNPDIRFSMVAPVEETDRMIAWHNMSEDALRSALEIGGLAMPSFAVMRANNAHTDYGSISVVASKDSIKPGRNQSIFGGDAWTPIVPEINYKIRAGSVDDIYDKLQSILSKADIKVNDLWNTLDTDNVRDRVRNYRGDIVDAFEREEALRLAYLLDKGDKVRIPYKEKRFSWDVPNAFLKKIVKAFDTIPNNSSDEMAQEPKLRTMLHNFYEVTTGKEMADSLVPMNKPLDFARVDELFYSARQMNNAKSLTEIDKNKLRDTLKSRLKTKKAQAEYKAWLKNLMGNLIEKKGIRNNVDFFTPMGNRRSFEALHYDYTLANIVKAMKGQEKQGRTQLFASSGSIKGAALKEYSNIEEVRKDLSRLHTQEEYENSEELKGAYDKFSDHALEISHKLSDNPFTGGDILAEVLYHARTKDGILRYLKREYDFINPTEQLAEEIEGLGKEANTLPMEYFEAKLYRAFPIEEALAYVVPSNMDKALKQQLKDTGVTVKTYKAGDNADRLAKVNSVKGARFSQVPTSNTELAKENRKLKKDLADSYKEIQKWKDEIKITNPLKVRYEDVKKISNTFRKKYSSTMTKAELEAKFKEFGDYVLNASNDKSMSAEEYAQNVKAMAVDLASDLVHSSEELIVNYPEYEDVKKHLMQGVSISDEDKANIPDFETFRKANFGNVRIKNSGSSVDTVYEELNGLYPYLFPDEITHPADRLLRMAAVAEEIKPTYGNPFEQYGYDMAGIVETVANDIVENAAYGQLRATRKSFADKQAEKIKGLESKISELTEDNQALSESNKEKVSKDKYTAMVQALKDKKKEDLLSLKEHYKEKERRTREKRNASTLRKKIEKHCQDLSAKLLKPTDKKHITELRGVREGKDMESLKSVTAKVLSLINRESTFAYASEDGAKHAQPGDMFFPTAKTEAMRELQKAYESIAKDGDYLSDEAMLGTDGWIADIIEFADKPLGELNTEQLQKIYNCLRSLEKTIDSANKLLSTDKSMGDVAYAFKDETEGKKEKLIFPIQKLNDFAISLLTPQAFFERMGKVGDMLFGELRGAQNNYISNTKILRDWIKENKIGEARAEWQDEEHVVRLGGADVKMSTPMLMELYVLAKRPQALDHILDGGIAFTEVQKKKLKYQKQVYRGITMEQLSKAFSQLSAEQIKVADMMQSYASNELSALGNKASMDVYGYEKFTEDNYWRIRVKETELQRDNVHDKPQSPASVANKGMTKQTVDNPNSALYIDDIFKTFLDHAVDMNSYASYLAVQEDMRRLFNYKFYEDGVKMGTFQELLEQNFGGRQGGAYWTKLMQDIANGVGSSNLLSGGLIGKFKAAAVGANLRVVVQQPTAILRAMDMIDGKYLAIGAAHPWKGSKEAIKYSPLAQWKNWGYFDINTGRSLEDLVYDTTDLKTKAEEVMMKPAGAADDFAWGILWNAVKAEVKDKNPNLKPGSKEYFDVVKKRFEHIVDRTQVVDGILQRSGILREGDMFTKTVTAFMGEPIKQYNQFMNAIYNLRQGKVSNGMVARTVFAMASAGMLNAVVKSIVDAMRKSDRDKDYFTRWLEEFTGIKDGEWNLKNFSDSNMFELVDVPSYIPIARDVESIVKGYTVERSDMAVIADVVKSYQTFLKAMNGEGKLTMPYAIANFSSELAKLFGIPASNIKRDLMSFTDTLVNDIIKDDVTLAYNYNKLFYDVNKNKARFTKLLDEARQKGDMNAYEYILEDLKTKGFEEDKIVNSLNNLQKQKKNSRPKRR